MTWKTINDNYRYRYKVPETGIVLELRVNTDLSATLYIRIKVGNTTILDSVYLDRKSSIKTLKKHALVTFKEHLNCVYYQTKQYRLVVNKLIKQKNYIRQQNQTVEVKRGV